MDKLSIPHYTFTRNQEKYIAFNETQLLKLSHQVHTKFPNETKLLTFINEMLKSITEE